MCLNPSNAQGINEQGTKITLEYNANFFIFLKHNLIIMILMLGIIA